MQLLLDQLIASEGGWRACDRRLHRIFDAYELEPITALHVRAICNLVPWISSDLPDYQVRLARVGTEVELRLTHPGIPNAMLGERCRQFYEGLSLNRYEQIGEQHVATLRMAISKQKPPRVVVIDDDLVFALLVKEFLSPRYDVALFTEPREALEAIVAAPPQLVICDIEMPQMNGWELREKLLYDEQTSLLPFIFLTGNTDDQYRARASGQAVDDFVGKPIDKNKLLDTVERVLNRYVHLIQRLGDRLDRIITDHLMPEAPVVDSAFETSFFTRCHGAGGGDFVLRKVQSDGSTLVALGDVMGHDEAARFFCYAHIGFFYGLFHSPLPDLGAAECLQRFNQSLFEHPLYDESMVTMVVARFMPDGRVSVSCAGHPAPILCRCDGSLQEVDVSGMLLGLMEETRYEEVTLALNAGDRLLLFTDGLFDALQGAVSNIEAEAEIWDLLHRCGSASGRKIVSALAERFVRSDISDDVTVCVFDRVPLE